MTRKKDTIKEPGESKTQRLTIYFKQGEREEIEEAAKRDGRSLNNFVQQAIKEYMKKAEK